MGKVYWRSIFSELIPQTKDEKTEMIFVIWGRLLATLELVWLSNEKYLVPG